METIKVFNSPQFGEVRTAGTSDNPMFCLSDLCRCLCLSAKGVNQRLSKEVISTYPLETAGGMQQALFVNEDGLYDVILDSRKPEAKAFRKWITSEVLPSIRKTGGYIATKHDDTPDEIMARALLVAQQTLAKREERLKQLEADNAAKEQTIQIQTEQIKQSAPKVKYYDDTLQSVNTLTATQVAKERGMDAEKLNRKLKEAGIIYRQSGQWIVKQPYASWGLHKTRTQTYTRSDGSLGTNTYLVWTQKGKMFILTLIDNDYNVRNTIRQIKGKNEKIA